MLALLIWAPLVLSSEETAVIDKYVRAYYIPGWGDSATMFAHSLAKIGDMNGDGITDIAAGTPYDGDDDDGRVVIMFLQTTGAWSAYNTISTSDLGIENGNKPRLGFGLARIDDRNDDDGGVDLAMSSIGAYSLSPYPEGCVHLAHLTSSGDVTGTVRHLNGSFYGVTEKGANFGWAIAACGNWSESNSAEHDLLVGAPGHREQGRNGTGCVFLLNPWNYPNNRSASRVCAGEVSPGDVGAAATNLGSSLAYLGGRSVAVGAPLGGNAGEGAVWLLTLSATLGVERAVMLQTDRVLDLSSGNNFGAAVAVLSSVEPEDGGVCSSGDAPGWDWDRDCGTLDLAVGAPYMDGESGDTDYYQSGVVFLITMDSSTGLILNHYSIKNFDGVPYYSGGTISDLLGIRDYFGSSLACLGDIDSNGELELLAGAPGYSRSMNNNRGGGWMSMFLHQPTPAPILSPTKTSTPTMTAAPSDVPSAEPTHPPSMSPTSTNTVGVNVRFIIHAADPPSDNDTSMLKTTVASALTVGENQLKHFEVEGTNSTVSPQRQLLQVKNWEVAFTVTTELATNGMTSEEYGSTVETTLTSDAFASSVATALHNMTVDSNSITIVVLTRISSMVPVPQPTLMSNSEQFPSKLPTRVPTAPPLSQPSDPNSAILVTVPFALIVISIVCVPLLSCVMTLQSHLGYCSLKRSSLTTTVVAADSILSNNSPQHERIISIELVTMPRVDLEDISEESNVAHRDHNDSIDEMPWAEVDDARGEVSEAHRDHTNSIDVFPSWMELDDEGGAGHAHHDLMGSIDVSLWMGLEANRRGSSATHRNHTNSIDELPIIEQERNDKGGAGVTHRNHMDSTDGLSIVELENYKRETSAALQDHKNLIDSLPPVELEDIKEGNLLQELRARQSTREVML